MSFFTTYFNREFAVLLLAFIGVLATILTLALPYLQTDQLSARLGAVTKHREQMKASARVTRDSKKTRGLRQSSDGYMQDIVERFSLRNILESPETKTKLSQAGFRGQAPLVAFLFFRLVMPGIVFLGALFFLFVMKGMDASDPVKFGIAVAAGGAGFYLPNVYLENIIGKRKASISRAFPDALDLMLICVEAGMTIEVAFNRVAREIGSQSVELAEELGLTTAELTYLSDRRIALENLGVRTDLDGVKAVVTSLIQSERYGTPLGSTLRVMAQENRDMRMSAAEKKAGALPAQLTVPMILFFLPVLFVVILGPAFITMSSR